MIVYTYTIMCKVLDDIPADFRLDEVKVRLVRDRETQCWNRLMDEHHYLGFKRFVGQHLRYVMEWRGQWLGVAGWQCGAFKCQPRDRWIGWSKKVHFKRLHLIANNTRYVLFTAPGAVPNLATYAMSRMLRALRDDWRSKWGYEVVLAETFVDPSRFRGHLYEAGGWSYVGDSKGYARHNGRYTNQPKQRKKMYVRALRKDARRLLCQADELPYPWQPLGEVSRRSTDELRSLYEEFSRVADYRRAQGRKHTVASVLSIYVLARISGFLGYNQASKFAQHLSQDELKALGAWYNRHTGAYEPVSRATLHRVVSNIDPAQLEAVVVRYGMPRLKLGAALSADGKRIRGANRNGDAHHETVTLVAHGSGQPLASIGYFEDGGERAALVDLLEQVDLRGRVLTLDALHTTRKMARLIVEAHDADYLLTVKGNCPQTHQELALIDWTNPELDSSQEKWQKGHGRVERRSIKALTAPAKWLNYPYVQQVFRIRRERQHLNTDKTSEEIVYGITSLSSPKADAERLLALNRGHWAVENLNHRIRDDQFEEDDSLVRKHYGPHNNATLNNLAIAVIFHHGFDSIPEATLHFALTRKDAMTAIMTPT